MLRSISRSQFDALRLGLPETDSVRKSGTSAPFRYIRSRQIDRIEQNSAKGLLEYARGWQREESEPQMGIYKRGNVYWIDFYDQNRKRIQESSQSSNWRDAENLSDAPKVGSLRGIYKQPVKITFGEFGKRYMEHAKTNKRSWLRDEQMLEHLNEVFRKRKAAHRSDPRRNRGLQVAERESLRLNGESGVGFTQANVQSRNHVGPLLELESRSKSEILSGIQYRASRV